MKKTFTMLAMLFSAMTHADSLHISQHYADADSITGFRVMITRHDSNGPTPEDFTLYYEIDGAPDSIGCAPALQCVLDIDSSQGLTVSQQSYDQFDIFNNASGGISTPLTSSGSVTQITQVNINPQPVMQSIQQQLDRDARHISYTFDRLVSQRLGWEMRSGEDAQQLSLALPTQIPVSLNLTQEEVGDTPRTRLDMVTGQSWQQGMWRMSWMASLGAGEREGAQSHWYGAGFDAWFTRDQSGMFARISQQFSDEAARQVDGLDLSAWQNQTLSKAVGWRHQQRSWGISWDVSMGLERSQNSTVGMVGLNDQWQAITSLPDQQGSFVSVGLGNRNARNAWRVGLDHFRGDTQLVVNWGW